MTLIEDAAAAGAALGEGAALASALRELARGAPNELDAHLQEFGEASVLNETKATYRTYFVASTAAGVPRVDQLAERLSHAVVDYCIPRSRIDEATRAMLEKGTTAPYLKLQSEARALFTHIVNSGEGGELLLYLLLELVLRIPQVLCKMPLKTSTAMHVHGADGVHAAPTEHGGLAVYWGESKLYADIGAGVRACMESLAELLTGRTRL